jgi:hypothetical protein
LGHLELLLGQEGVQVGISVGVAIGEVHLVVWVAVTVPESQTIKLLRHPILLHLRDAIPKIHKILSPA